MEVAKDAHKKSLSDSVPLDPKTLRNNLQVCVLSPEHFVLVLELEGRIEGAFIGVTHQLWYSKKKQASDLFRRTFISNTLKSTSGNRAKAARILDIQRSYLSRLIKELEIK